MRFAYKQPFSLGLFLLLIAKVSGQPKCKVEYYSTEQGLSHQRVTAMLKDREGFMWFGSWDGINRFDGHIFVSYKSFPGDKFQLGNDRIDHMIEDEAGHLWIQAYDGQIYRFDKKDKQFLPLSTIINPDGKQKTIFSTILAASGGWLWLQSVKEGLFCVSQTNLSQEHFFRYRKEAAEDYQLPANKISFFHEDREHRIWIGTPDGLCCLERSTTGIYKNNKLVSPGIATGITLTAFNEDADHLYFSTTTGNLITFEKGSRTFFVRKIASGRLNALLRSKKKDVLYATASLGEVITVDLKTQKFTTTRYYSAERLYALYEDQTGSLWIEPEKRGAIRFDPLSHSFQAFSLTTGESLNYIGNRFRILEDDNGTTWVNMKEGGFGYYDPDKKNIAYILNTPDAAAYRLPEIVYTIYYDKAGILWLTTNERDLIKIVLQGDNFKQQLLVTSASSKSDNEVRGIFYDKKGRLWIGAKRGNLYIYQNDVPITNLFVNEPPEGLGGIYSILQDSRGNIWMGTKGHGLYKASPVNKEETKYHLENFVRNTTDSNSLPCNEIYALLEDRQGRIWIGSFDNGLALVVNEPNGTRFTHIGEALKQYPGGPFQKIRHMALDGEGNIWIGTTNGLLVLDANHQHLPVYQHKTYSKVPGDKESLGNNDIQFIHQDSKNRMWLATSGGGFCQAIGKKPFQSLQFKNYTTRDGLPNDYILSCAEDKQQNLWIATENGLSKFNPETGVFRNYDSYDGLPKIAFSEASACREFPSGHLAFGTRHGYLFFDPKHLSSKPIPATIALTNLQINNEDAGPGANESVLKTDINSVSSLTLKYNQNIISIDYAIPDYRTGNRQAFAYRLLGFDTTWHDDRQQRRSTYTNLPPGHYVFEVKSGSSDLYLNQPYRQLAITILPPPWKTGWAYLLYAVLAVALLFFIRRYALAMIRLRNKIAVEQKLAALKLNFFTNVSHELRTPLTLIINPLEQVARKEKLSPETASYIDVARKNAARMVRFINQLLDLRKVQSEKATLHISRVEVVSFVKGIAEHFTEAAGSKRIKLDISSDGKELIAWIDAEKLDVVIYNLLGNAIKFTPEGKLIRILIETIPGEKSFSIAVCDQGPGVPGEKLEEIFELFHEGGPSGEKELKGTGIGLALSREFVNLHGGNIWAENNRDGGLTVKLQLKLGTEHYQQENSSFVDLPEAVPLYEKPVRRAPLPQPGHPELPEGQEAPLVLLVEDNDDLRTFIRGQLSEYYRVEVAGNGEEGLQKAINLMPDLIVSDIMMPKMDGIEMLDKVKNDISTSHIPVVLLSAKYSIESQIAGLKYGADYYITKPFNNEFLVASIDNLLRQRKKLFEVLIGKEKPVAPGPEPVTITSRDELFLKEVVRVVEDKMADVDFNMEAVAGTMAMSYSNFYKKFKSLTGSVPVEFVRDMRLQRARQLLEAGGNNVSEVAYMVGFSNPKYFSTCFKEKYRVSPSDYLKTNTSEKTRNNLKE